MQRSGRYLHLLGGLRYREQDFQVPGANLYLSVLVVLATITLILPNYTLTTPGPVYSAAQLAFVSVVTVILYGVFLYTQTMRHRDYFISGAAGDADAERSMSNRMLAMSVALLLVSLLAVVLLAKKFSLVVDVGTALIGAPPAFAGVLVALLILLPESVAAISAARKNDLQKSINLALGSSLATIGLTIPAVAVAAYALDKRLVLGLNRAGDGAAAVDVRPEHADLRHRPHQYPVRPGPYGGVCGIRVHGVCAVTSWRKQQ